MKLRAGARRDPERSITETARLKVMPTAHANTIAQPSPFRDAQEGMKETRRRMEQRGCDARLCMG
ncbi:MAG TPA: hypothetical protein VHN14_06310, partial [Kofleriaceae bacterium]|nr:hypothetical protein [Kofleriaceae bacterium]